MAENLDNLFEQLCLALQTSEKRHRAVRDSASDRSDWAVHDKEVEIISRIINWRRNLESLRSEISTTNVVSDGDVLVSYATANGLNPASDDIMSTATESYREQTDIPYSTDDKKLGYYIRQKMRDLSNTRFNFSEEEIENLQNAQWCSQYLNIPHQFFLKTTREVRNYWKRDLFKFNGKQFRLCMTWYNGLYRGRSQRECFDKWYNSLGASVSSLANGTGGEDKVGSYIRRKMRELSESGFVFTDEQILQMCEVVWSKQTFTYNYRLPFAKLVDARRSISEQIKDDKGSNRYWNEVFTYGNNSIIINSQWYDKDKASFDRWYAGLTRITPAIEEGTLLLNKIVDWSTLNYGITIPIVNWDIFNDAIGGAVEDGSSREVDIEIVISGEKYGNYKAYVSHTISGFTNSVQIRYSTNSEIASDLREIFNGTFEYCLHERRIHGDNTRITIPDDKVERIIIIASGTIGLLVFSCKPLESNSSISSATQDAPASFQEERIVRTKRSKFTLFGKTYPVSAWNDMFVKVCEVLLLHNPHVMAAMDKDRELNTEKTANFSYVESDMKRNGKRLSNGLWIETAFNNRDTLRICHRLLEKCGFLPDELVVETREVV